MPGICRGGLLEVLRDERRHLEHGDLLLAVEHDLENVVSVDHPTVLRILQAVLLDVDPELLGHLAAGEGLGSGHLRQSLARLKGLHERAVRLLGCHDLSLLSTLRETIAAIHGTIAARLERNLGGLAALAADRAEHLAGTAAAATGAAAAAETAAAAATASASAPAPARGLLRRAARSAAPPLARATELRETL